MNHNITVVHIRDHSFTTINVVMLWNFFCCDALIMHTPYSNKSYVNPLDSDYLPDYCLNFYQSAVGLLLPSRNAATASKAIFICY